VVVGHAQEASMALKAELGQQHGGQPMGGPWVALVETVRLGFLVVPASGARRHTGDWGRKLVGR
jgi:hypothetical protein